MPAPHTTIPANVERETSNLKVVKDKKREKLSHAG
jgi:hypothetical protein